VYNAGEHVGPAGCHQAERLSSGAACF
jgi:hypothetical protein